MVHVSDSRPRPNRRTALTLVAGTAVTTMWPLAGPPAHAASRRGSLAGRLAALEEEYGARLGLYAHDTATGRRLTHRARERFALCSTFKTLTAAAVLRDLDHDSSHLARRVHYTAEEVEPAGYIPVTGREENLANGLTVAELCAAAVSESDNGAANLLLRQLGGPTAVTRFSRSLGDPVTRLDRYEPDLNSAEPWRTTDTTTPYALGRTNARLLLGRALEPTDRRLLRRWLVENTTNGERFGKGLPDDWVLADKTGGGDAYGVANDVGVVWPPGRSPIVLAVLSTTHDPAGPGQDALVARTAGLVAEELT
ncbi:class A beta-lactamase [Streptomyces sp. NPDC005438]|uniref:class A beta-lactamase n=1 Tax=Streptomyces sp. NPDC005438 TaxID=3156880 RepID=UPI0033BC9324